MVNYIIYFKNISSIFKRKILVCIKSQVHVLLSDMTIHHYYPISFQRIFTMRQELGYPKLVTWKILVFQLFLPYRENKIHFHETSHHLVKRYMYTRCKHGTLIKSSYHLHWWVGVQTPYPPCQNMTNIKKCITNIHCISQNKYLTLYLQFYPIYKD